MRFEINGLGGTDRNVVMWRVFKYQMSIGIQSLMLPAVFKPLCVNEQNGRTVLWAMVDTESGTLERTFNVVGTDQDVESLDTSEYLGTAFVGSLVWHVFMETAVSNSKKGE